MRVRGEYRERRKKNEVEKKKEGKSKIYWKVFPLKGPIFTRALVGKRLCYPGKQRKEKRR